MRNEKGIAKTPPDPVIQPVLEAYERGQTIDALRLATEFAPLKDWAGARGCSLAARIAMNAGGVRLPAVLAVRAWRAGRTHPLSQFEYGMQIYQRRGPLALWLAMRSWPAAGDGNPEWQADLLALKCTAASQLRDFKVAERLIDQAESLGPKAPWVHLQRALLLEKLEKVEEALQVVTAACKLHPHPFYRPGVQALAHLLQLLDRDEEAIQLLQQADASLQSALLPAQLYGLLANNQQWPAAERALERYAALSPLLEPGPKLWLQAQRAWVAYQLGRREDARNYAAELKDPFHRQFSEKLAQPPPAPEQVRLEVPFVRQHFKTCAPATMAAIGRYWNMPAEHLALVETVCYDGTPPWQQRDWAERNGWSVREFRVTWESARALLTRGVPFAITTVEASSAHMRAVMGFDRTRGVLLLRDPSQPYCLESPAEAFLAYYRPFGPRGTVFIPRAESARLEGIDLPDSELYDERHALGLALSRYNREGAQSALERLESKWPDHEVTWDARQELAAYDANPVEEIRCLDRLLGFFHHSPARLLRRLACMQDASREERIEFLEKASAPKTADPALFVELGRTLSADASQQTAAARWLRRALRKRPMDSAVMSALAELKWRLGQFEEATELYWFAATVEGYREPLYQSWFGACRQVRQTEAALAHLEDRFQRFGSRSPQPALTLAWALCEVEQPDRARAVLLEAFQMRPDDGYLMIRAATLNARLGAWKYADVLLESAKGKVRANDWLRSAAEMAELRHDAKGTLQFSREILAMEPLAVDAHGGVARSLAQIEGRAATLAHLQDASARHPHHCGLRRLLIEWSRAAGPEAVISSARDFLKFSPHDAWMRRELAWALANANRLDEALAEAAEAYRIEPRNPYSAGSLAHVHERLRHFPEARECFRQAVRLSVDHSSAIAGLLRLANTDRERREELDFIERELVRQVVRGDGLLAFMDAASTLLEPEALLKILRQAHAERPDLWHAWSALVVQLDRMGRYDEALPLALNATERFPHLPRLWLDLAAIHRRRNEAEAEIAAAQWAFEINPGWSQSAIALAGALERHRTLGEAKGVYERALRHAPADPQLHVQMASILWRLRQPKEALASVESALRLASNTGWAWSMLISWSRECGQPGRPLEFTRELTRARPGDLHGWLMLAKLLAGPQASADRLQAVNRALELNPQSFEAWDLKAELLAEASQFEAAIEACDRGVAVCTADAFALRGRRAWVEAQRGQVPEAIRQMRAVLADNAGYAWGWTQLAAWLTGQKAYADAEGAIERLLKLQPQNLWARRQLALVRLQQGDKVGAEKSLRAVLDASPTDQFAAENLFNLQLEVGNLAGATEILRRMQTHQPGARCLAYEVILNTRTGNQPKALELFKTLCAQPDPDPWPVQAAADALKKAGLTGRALTILSQALGGEACNPQAGAVAMQILLDKRHSLRATWLFGRIRSAGARTRAAPGLANGLGKLNAKWSLRILLRRHGEEFRKNDAAWGQVGYALTRFNNMRGVAQWMADWRSRPILEPYMLFNLCYALRNLGRYPQANEVAEYAVQKWGNRKHEGADLRLFLAVEKALAGSTSEAMEVLKRVNVRKTAAYDQQLFAIAKALVEFQQSSPEARRQQFKAARRQLAAVFPARSVFRPGTDVRRTFARAGKVFAQNGGGHAARVWFFWKLNWQWALLLLALLFGISHQLPLPWR